MGTFLELLEIKNYLIKIKSENGRIIGIFPHQMIPLELIHAFNTNPLVLSFAGNEDICSLGTEYLTPATCPFARVCLGLLENNFDIYSNLDAIIGFNYCNGDLCAGDYIYKYFNIPYIDFAFPTRVSNHGKLYYLNQVKKLQKSLEQFLNKTVQEENLRQSIRLYNQLRKKLQKIKSKIGMGSRFQALIHNFYLFGPEKCIQEIDTINQIDTKLDKNGVDILFLGSFVGYGDKILNVIEDNKINIKKNQSESIFYFEKEVKNDEPIRNLADYYITNNYSFRLMNNDDKIKQIIREYEEGNFKAVILHILKFCDLYVGEISKFKSIMAENEIPTLILERDYSENLGQLNTRIEAFREIIS